LPVIEKINIPELGMTIDTFAGVLNRGTQQLDIAGMLDGAGAKPRARTSRR
jgi:hypothetical protein